MPFITEIKTFAALGSGVIGSGWVARALAHGLDVLAWDPAPVQELNFHLDRAALKPSFSRICKWTFGGL